MSTIRTSNLEIDYDDGGPRDAPVVLLLHGWPDDRSSWARVAAVLNEAGLRTIAPSLRGFGATRFLSESSPRTGNSAILAVDAIGLMDALGIDRFSVTGHDWGSNAAEALAVGWPQRVERLAMLGTPSRLGGMPTPPFEQVQRQWYHWFMATGRGAQAVRDDRRGFAHIHWVNWSPAGWFTEATFESVARAFDNPDWVDVTLHSYRARWDEAPPDPDSAWLEDRIKSTPALSLPTLYFQGEADGINPPSASRSVPSKFDGPFETVSLSGVGHFIQREAPEAVARRLVAHFVRPTAQSELTFAALSSDSPTNRRSAMSGTSLSNMSSSPPTAASAGGIAAIPYDASFEVVEDDEAETQDELNKTFVEIGDTTFKDIGLGLRTVHAKSHGLLRGELKVLDVAAPYAQGLFAAAKAYPVALRFSTAPGDLLDDNVSTPRGLAIKVIGVDGARLPGGEGQRTQDFLLTNGKAFTAPNPKKFLSNLKLLAATTDRVPKLKQAFSAVLQSTEALLESLGAESATLKSLGGHPETNLLGETFYSQVPFLYGPYMAKFSVAPIPPELIALKDVPVDLDGKPDGLRAAVVDHFATHGGEWEFRVQLCTDLDKMPIEDATVEWSEEQSPLVAVARLSVSPQLAWSDELSAQMDDGLSFAPWHGLAAHRPLGSINRARRFAYPASAEARSPRGRCPVHEPNA